MPCHLECAVCSDEEALRQYHGGKWVAPKEDPEWVDMSRRAQLAPMGQVGWLHPENCGVQQLINALQNGQQGHSTSGPLGTPHISI